MLELSVVTALGVTQAAEWNAFPEHACAWKATLKGRFLGFATLLLFILQHSVMCLLGQEFAVSF